MAWNSKKPKQQRGVHEKQEHYGELLSKQESVNKTAYKSEKEARRISYAAGYMEAVKDCREALLKSKK